MSHEPAAPDVREYYERNTATFLRLGAEGVIHRALWGPGVTTLPEALHFAHAELSRRLVGVRRVLDLGCGVGGTARSLAARNPELTVVGVTLSPTQVLLARERGDADGRCTFVEADFCALPAALGTFDAAFAIEAFAHAPEPGAFFDSVAARVRPGGHLWILDDVVAPGTDPADPVVVRFREGWRVPSVRPVPELVAAARGWTLVEDLDWTLLVRTWRPRDRLVHALQPVLRLAAVLHPWFGSLVGGDALQVGLSTGRLQYRLLGWRRDG